MTRRIAAARAQPRSTRSAPPRADVGDPQRAARRLHPRPSDASQSAPKHRRNTPQKKKKKKLQPKQKKLNIKKNKKKKKNSQKQTKKHPQKKNTQKTPPPPPPHKTQTKKKKKKPPPHLSQHKKKKKPPPPPPKKKKKKNKKPSPPPTPKKPGERARRMGPGDDARRDMEWGARAPRPLDARRRARTRPDTAGWLGRPEEPLAPPRVDLREGQPLETRGSLGPSSGCPGSAAGEGAPRKVGAEVRLRERHSGTSAGGGRHSRTPLRHPRLRGAPPTQRRQNLLMWGSGRSIDARASSAIDQAARCRVQVRGMPSIDGVRLGLAAGGGAYHQDSWRRPCPFPCGRQLGRGGLQGGRHKGLYARRDRGAGRARRVEQAQREALEGQGAGQARAPDASQSVRHGARGTTLASDAGSGRGREARTGLSNRASTA